MGRTNRASGNDRIDLQVGEVKGRKTPKPPKPAKPSTGRVENIRSSGARVGWQADEIHDDLTIR